jgi:hypothetical protein
MPALGQAGDWLTGLPVCDRVPVLAELVNDALGTHWQMDVRVGQELSRVLEPKSLLENSGGP